MKRLGFHTLLAPEDAGPIIQTFLTPRDRKFDFQKFYEALKLRGFVIYPGKLTRRDQASASATSARSTPR